MSEPIEANPIARFWAAASNGRFELPFCEQCLKPHFYPRDRCPSCGSVHLVWRAAESKGTLYSFSVVTRAPIPAFADSVPYIVAIVKLAEGPHLMGRLSCPVEAVAIGMSVTVAFGASPVGKPMLMFKPDQLDT